MTSIVLAGIGHGHLHVLTAWRKHPLPNARLVCLSEFPNASYSGMLPGVLAGLYQPQQINIDLEAACRAAGAELHIGEIIDVDTARRSLLIRDGRRVSFDILSIDTGSVPQQADAQRDATVVSIKPMQTLLERLSARIALWYTPQREVALLPAFRVTVVGGGAGGVELAFCLPAFVERELSRLRSNDVAAPASAPRVKMTLLHGAAQLGSGSTDKTRTVAAKLLRDRGVNLLLGRQATRITDGEIFLDDGSVVSADLVVWATHAAPSPLLAKIDLPKDEHGFLLTDVYLRSTSGQPVMAVGDCASGTQRRAPKAGVIAVHQGPVLWNNLSRLVDGDKNLAPFTPQTDFLKLFNTADGRTLLEYRSMTIHSRWCWWLKDWIDRRFVARHRDAAHF